MASYIKESSVWNTLDSFVILRVRIRLLKTVKSVI